LRVVSAKDFLLIAEVRNGAAVTDEGESLLVEGGGVAGVPDVLYANGARIEIENVPGMVVGIEAWTFRHIPDVVDVARDLRRLHPSLLLPVPGPRFRVCWLTAQCLYTPRLRHWFT